MRSVLHPSRPRFDGLRLHPFRWGRIRVRTAFALLLLLAGFSGLAEGQERVETENWPAFRESDQASLVDGALRLQRGESRRGADFYNYDKQYLSYWLCVPPGGSRDAGDVVRWVNLASGSVAVFGFWVLWIAWLRRPSRSGLIAAAVFFLSPLALLSVAPASSATISAGFLLCLIALLSQPGRWWRRALVVLGPILVFAAVAARADAVLCLPLLCWAAFHGRHWRRFRTRPLFWSMALAAVLALGVGRWLVDEATTTFYGGFFEPKVAAAFVVFGLGACGLWLVVQIVGLGAASRRGFHWLGVGLLLLPLAFYAWQLYSPRHLMTTGLVALAAGFLWKGRLIYRFWSRRQPQTVRVVSIAVLVAAALPLVVGLYLPTPTSPRLVLTRATEFPTADGRWPMGALLSFLSRMRHADVAPVDHNQSVAQAALQADYTGCSAEGPVPIMETDLRAYLALAVRFADREPEIVSWQHVLDGEVDCVYAEERALRVSSAVWIHGDRDKASSAHFAAGELGIERVSPLVHGQGIVRITPEGLVEPAIAERLAVAAAFGGDEFESRGEVADRWQPGTRDDGRTAVLSSRSAGFSANGRAAEAVDGHYLLRLSASEIREAGGITLDAPPEAKPVRLWIGALPEYMSRTRLGRGAGEN